MKLTQSSSRLKYHTDAYRFVFDALQFTQEKLHRPKLSDPDDESAHISGQELLEGVRELALKKFGLMSRSVFAYWGISATEDFGRIVFELVERGEMRATERDRLGDFLNVYDFDDALDRDALGQYLQYGWISQPRSIYRRIRKLPPGCLVEIAVDASPSDPQPAPFWSAGDVLSRSRAKPFEGSLSDAVDACSSIAWAMPQPPLLPKSSILV